MHDMKHPGLAQKSLNGKINIKKIGMAINQDVDPLKTGTKSHANMKNIKFESSISVQIN